MTERGGNRLRRREATVPAPDVTLEDGLESLPLHAVLLDRDLRVQWLNQRSRSTLRLFAGELGWTAEELVGRHVEALHPLPDYVRDLLHVPVRQSRHLSCAGGDVVMDFLLQPVLDDRGHIARLLLIWEVAPRASGDPLDATDHHEAGLRWSPVSHGRVPCTLRIARHPAPPEPAAPLPQAPCEAPAPERRG